MWKEVKKLDAYDTWNWGDVMEAGAAKRKYLDGQFARCFPIVGLKNVEQ